MLCVVTLDDPRSADRSLAGGKGANLAQLAAAGFAIPSAFIIAAEATASLPAAVGQWPGPFVADVLRAYGALGAGQVAVRSSGVDEDGQRASFAGQYATVLNVGSDDQLLAAIATCLASLDAESAAAYRARSTGERGDMAIVVQRMVRSDLAGVAFTADPLTGDRSRVVVEAVPGLGEGLVSGAEEADRIVVSRAGLAVVEVHTPRGALNTEFATEAARKALAAEALFGTPQDVEFAFEEGVFWMLQSRPVTVSGSAETSPGELDTVPRADELWTSANIQEVLPGLLSPLGMSLARQLDRAYLVGYRKVKMLANDESPAFVGFFHHRAFLNVNATRLIADRAFGSSGDAIEHRFLGGELKKRPRQRHSWKNWKHRFLSVVPGLRLLRTIHADAARIESETLAFERRLRDTDVSALTNAQLEALRRETADFLVGTFAVHLQSSGLAGAGFDQVSRLGRSVLKGKTEALTPTLFTGLPNVESARISLDLWALSRTAREAGLDERIRSAHFDPSASDLPHTWRRAFVAFLQRHGHRGINEMEASAKSWRVDTAQVMALVRSYLDLPEERAPAAQFRRQEESRLRLTVRIEKRMNPLRRALFRRVLRDAQRWVALREQTKSSVVRGSRLAEYFLPETQRRLVEAGTISAPEDLYFLVDSEVSVALTATAALDLHETVTRRRRAFERDRYLVLPDRFTGRPVPLSPPKADAGTMLEGTPVSPGQVTGRARVILDPSIDSPIQPGEILVAPVTDAGWTPLFALAIGLVVDIGSALSHGSTVAREYGLPAVVNVRTGTTGIRTGDLLRVDGSAGMVYILERANPT